MQHLSTLIVALTAFAAGTSALAIPSNKLTTKADIDCPATQLKTYQSNLFGWQLVGAATADYSINEICNDMNGSELGLGSVWNIFGDEGLLQGNIKNIVCQTTKQPALPKIRSINTKIYNTTVMNAFDLDNKTVSSYLCSSLDHSLIAAFNVSDNTIIDSVCKKAGSAPFAAPIEGTEPDQSVINSFVDAASQLYATQYASAARDDSTLNQWCARLPTAIENINGLDLNGEAVKDAVCGFEKPPCSVEGKEAVMEGTSRMFAIFIQNASSTQGWKEWLCGNLDVDRMNQLGLDGGMISQTVCGGSS